MCETRRGTALCVEPTKLGEACKRRREKPKMGRQFFAIFMLKTTENIEFDLFLLFVIFFFLLS